MNRIHLISFLIFSLALWTSCESDLNEDPSNPGNPNSGKTLSAEEASEYLVLKGHAKITGTLPTTNDGQLKLDVEDTIFVVKGYPLGSRIEVLHHPGENVAGYNLYLPGSSFYYHVPETIIEGQYQTPEENDTTSIIELNFDPPVDEVDYPYTIEIVIQPVDDGGNPLDEFERWVTVEDPEDASGAGSCNTIARPRSDNRIHWEWDFTIREFNGQILNVFAPGLASPINSQGAGCCSDSGRSYTTSNHPGCTNNGTSSGLTWVVLDVDDYVVRPFMFLQIYEDGSIDASGNEVKKQYNRSITNFCSEVVGYDFFNTDIGGTGTHDFTPGANYININWTSWQGGYRINSGSLIYTCNTMILSWGGEDKFSAVYKKPIFYDGNSNYNPVDFYSQWKPWFD